MDQAAWAFLGVLLGGIITGGTTWLGNRQAANRERDQWERQHKADEEVRERQERAEAQERLRAKLAEIYDRALYYSPTHLGSETRESVYERARWWNLLMLSYYAKESATYAELKSKISNGTLTAADIVDIAAHDPRWRIDYTPLP